jgi:hypothetical protein
VVECQKFVAIIGDSGLDERERTSGADKDTDEKEANRHPMSHEFLRKARRLLPRWCEIECAYYMRILELAQD